MTRWNGSRMTRMHALAPDAIDLVKRQQCSCAECGKTTANGKPYCSDHIDRLPYVAALLARLGTEYADEAPETDEHTRVRHTLCQECGQPIPASRQQRYAKYCRVKCKWLAVWKARRRRA